MPNRLPFRFSSSLDDAEPDVRLLVSAGARRVRGEVTLAAQTLDFQISAEWTDNEELAGRTLRVPYESIGSVVLRSGILTCRVRLTARDGASFTHVAPRSPREVTLLVPRKHKREAREFVSALQIRIAEARLNGPDSHPQR